MVKENPKKHVKHERIERKKIKQRGKGQEKAGAKMFLDKIIERTTSNLETVNLSLFTP
jgi:hypothetical protein